MHIRVGYELIYNCPQGAPMILIVNIHYSRASDIVIPDYLTTEPSVPITAYRDLFGNWCNRIVAPAGRIRLTSRGVLRDSGQSDVVVPSAQQHGWRICLKRRSSSCEGAATVKPMCCRRWRGTYSTKRRPDGRVCRRSAITSITTSRSVMSMRAARKRPLKHSTSAQESAATIPTSPLRSAAV